MLSHCWWCFCCTIIVTCCCCAALFRCIAPATSFAHNYCSHTQHNAANPLIYLCHSINALFFSLPCFISIPNAKPINNNYYIKTLYILWMETMQHRNCQHKFSTSSGREKAKCYEEQQKPISSSTATAAAILSVNMLIKYHLYFLPCLSKRKPWIAFKRKRNAKKKKGNAVAQHFKNFP